MIVVVFQVTMREGQGPRYFDLAAELRPELEDIDGFLSVERFESLTTPGKYVSISFWRDEAAIHRWREHDRHRIAQTLGKREIFQDFRISVAEVVRDYTMADAPDAPTRGAARHDRQAAALRRNLGRRKAQQRARAHVWPDGDGGG